MTNKLALGLATIVLATTSAVAADRPGTPTALRPVGGNSTAYDIAGVRLGMTPEEARTAAGSAGYVISRTPMSKSFEQLVLTKLRERKPTTAYVSSAQEKTPREMWAKGRAGETLWLRFAPTQAGPRLMFAKLSIDERRVTKVKFGEQVVAKYGTPSANYPGNVARFWCATGVSRCGADWVGADYPYLKHDYGASGPSLTLTDENRSSRAIENAVDAEVERRAPRGSASF